MKTVSSAREIEKLCKAHRVEFYEVASRVDSVFAFFESEDASPGNATGNPITRKDCHRKEGAHWTVGFNLTRTSLIVRARVVVLKGDRRHVVDAGVVYDIAEPFEVSNSTMLDFIGECGFPTLYPHVQAAVNEGATRLDKRADLLGYSYLSEMTKKLKTAGTPEEFIAPGDDET